MRLARTLCGYLGFACIARTFDARRRGRTRERDCFPGWLRAELQCCSCLIGDPELLRVFERQRLCGFLETGAQEAHTRPMHRLACIVAVSIAAIATVGLSSRGTADALHGNRLRREDPKAQDARAVHHQH